MDLLVPTRTRQRLTAAQRNRIIITLCITLVCAAFGFAQERAAADNTNIKHIAVIETQMDPEVGESTDISRSDLREITAVLRREALKNLPSDRYKVVSSEAVQAAAKDCSAGSCIEAIRREKIADYAVRGTLGKLRGRYSLIVEMFDVGNGNLVAVTPDPIRSSDLDELIDQSQAACAAMYKIFMGVRSQSTRQQTAPVPPPPTPAPAPQPSVYRLSVSANPSIGGKVTRTPNRSKLNAGTKISVTAQPAKGYTFVGWSEERDGAILSKEPVIEGVMNRHMELIANFTKNTPPPPPPPAVTAPTVAAPQAAPVVPIALPPPPTTATTPKTTAPQAAPVAPIAPPPPTATATTPKATAPQAAPVAPIPPPPVPQPQQPLPVQKNPTPPPAQKSAPVPPQQAQTPPKPIPTPKASSPFTTLPELPPAAEPETAPPQNRKPAPVKETTPPPLPTRKASSPFATLPDSI